jgi:hypothetical protein
VRQQRVSATPHHLFTYLMQTDSAGLSDGNWLNCFSSFIWVELVQLFHLMSTYSTRSVVECLPGKNSKDRIRISLEMRWIMPQSPFFDACVTMFSSVKRSTNEIVRWDDQTSLSSSEVTKVVVSVRPAMISWSPLRRKSCVGLSPYFVYDCRSRKMVNGLVVTVDCISRFEFMWSSHVTIYLRVVPDRSCPYRQWILRKIAREIVPSSRKLVVR